MTKVTVPIINLTDLKDLSNKELKDCFENLCASCPDTPSRETVHELLHELQVHQIELEMQNREISEAQHQLEEARDRYADLYDFAPVCYVTFDATGCIKEINLTGAAMLGQERGRLVGKPFSYWLTREDLKKFFKHLNQARRANCTLSEELQLKLDKGRFLDVRMESIAARQLIDNEPTCRSIIIDISARKRAERESEHTAEQLRLIADAMPAVIAYVDHEERIKFANRVYETWVRQPRSMILDRTIQEVIGGKVYNRIAEFVRITLAGKPVNFEIAIPNWGNRQREVSASYIPDFDAVGNVMGFYALIRDVTDVKRLEAEEKIRLLETARVARINSMGEMVAEIAHELNQPLAAISIYSDTVSRMLNKGTSDLQEILSALDEIRLQARRASQVISRVREFVGRHELHLKKTDINELVNEILNLIEVEARWHGIRLELELSQSIPAVFADRILVEQVILNLTRNAIEAMHAIDKDKRNLVIRTSQGKHHEIEFEVEDSGPGLSIVEINHVFEPFYSSKKHGMGMGLSISRSIIKAHHGRLWAIPNDLGGTTFTFTLPDTTKTD